MELNMIHNVTQYLTCAICDNDIRIHERFLRFGKYNICEDCMYWNMEEFDPEGDMADEEYDERNDSFDRR